MNWFECKVSYEKMMENGLQKKVSEVYLVDALSHAEAEAMVIEEMKSCINGEFSILTVRKANYMEVLTSERNDWWWRCRVSFIGLDEKFGAEKRINVLMLAAGDDIEDVIRRVKEAMRGSLSDYEIIGINKSNILDIILHN